MDIQFPCERQARGTELREETGALRRAELVADVLAAAAARAAEHPETHGLEPLLAELEAEQLDDGGDTPPACRVCGCTDEDCSQCIQATGMPCAWVEEDLCSRCDAASRLVTAPRCVPFDVSATELAWHREYWEARRARAEALLAERDLERAERNAAGSEEGGQCS